MAQKWTHLQELDLTLTFEGGALALIPLMRHCPHLVFLNAEAYYPLFNLEDCPQELELDLLERLLVTTHAYKSYNGQYSLCGSELTHEDLAASLVNLLPRLVLASGAKATRQDLDAMFARIEAPGRDHPCVGGTWQVDNRLERDAILHG